MPPPRLYRFLRPCQPSGCTLHVRWTSNGPRSKLLARRRDTARNSKAKVGEERTVYDATSDTAPSSNAHSEHSVSKVKTARQGSTVASRSSAFPRWADPQSEERDGALAHDTSGQQNTAGRQQGNLREAQIIHNGSPALHNDAGATELPLRKVPGPPIRFFEIEHSADQKLAPEGASYAKESREKSKTVSGVQDGTRTSKPRSGGLDGLGIRTDTSSYASLNGDDTPKAKEGMHLSWIHDHSADIRNDEQRLIRQIHTHSKNIKHLDQDHRSRVSMELQNEVPTVSQEADSQNHHPEKISQAPHSTSTPSTSEKEATSTSTKDSQPVSSVSSPTASEKSNGPSLFEELFPEAGNFVQPHVHERKSSYPKLELPSSVPLVRRTFHDRPPSLREQVVQSFQNRGEQMTVLQLLHCSTELTESDFRRVIPKGKHIESWVPDGGFHKIIPGRDPLSLERLPFYYLVFKNHESALAYQKNASRLHKLASLHRQSDILSAVPPPKGFLEDGEDVNLAISSYLLKPSSVPLQLNMLMQPYNPSLKNLIEQGGYKPIVPFHSLTGKRLWKVLLHIEGYEPSAADLFHIFSRHAKQRGLHWPFHNDDVNSAIHRLRDVVNLKSKLLPVSSANPRAAKTSSATSASALSANMHQSWVDTNDDPSLNFLINSEGGVAGGSEQQRQQNAKQINQMLVSRLYNRWIVEFEDEDAARRFVGIWHRRVLPEPKNGPASWREQEETRWCNCEVLW